MPTNISPATAIGLPTLPFCVTIAPADMNAAPASGFVPDCQTPRHTLWYSYVPTDDQTVFGATVEDASFNACISVWSGPVGAPVQLDQVCGITGIQFNVTPGTTYYIALDGGIVTVTEDITLCVLPPPDDPCPEGSILILNDILGFPATVISGDDGTMLKALALSTTEMGDNLPSGAFALMSQDPVTGFVTSVDLYASDLSLILQNTAAVDRANQVTTSPVRANRDDTFYLFARGNGDPAVLSTMSGAGVVGPTTWTLPANSATSEAMCVNDDETIVYYTESKISTGTLHCFVHAYDLIGLAPLADLIDFGANTIALRDMFTLPSGNLLIPYKHTLTTVVQAAIVDPAGSVVRTDTIGASLGSAARFALGVDYTTYESMHFLAPDTNPSRFQTFQISDGTLLNTFDVLTWKPGSFTPIFAPAQSCPLLILRQPIEPETCATIICPQGYGVFEKTIRRERITPHLSVDQKNVFYPAIQVEVRPGTGNTIPPGVTPKVMLSVSFDGGYNWTPETWMSAGELGNYRARVIARQLGYGRDVVFKVVVSDPNAWDLVAAYFDPPPKVGRH